MINIFKKIGRALGFKKSDTTKEEKVVEVPYKLELKRETIFIEGEELEVIRHEGMAAGIKRVPVKVHKRYRIQKKWNKRYGFKTVVIPNMKVYRYGNTLIGHPRAIYKLIKQLEETGGNK